MGILWIYGDPSLSDNNGNPLCWLWKTLGEMQLLLTLMRIKDNCPEHRRTPFPPWRGVCPAVSDDETQFAGLWWLGPWYVLSEHKIQFFFQALIPEMHIHYDHEMGDVLDCSGQEPGKLWLPLLASMLDGRKYLLTSFIGRVGKVTALQLSSSCCLLYQHWLTER